MGIKSNNPFQSYHDFFSETGNLIDFQEGEVVFNTSGAHTWVAPASAAHFGISVVCVGGGGGARGIAGGGGGGGLGYKNNISVTAGQSYPLVVGDGGSASNSTGDGTDNAGGDSYFIDATTVKGGGGVGGSRNAGPTHGGTGGAGGGKVGDGGGDGGTGGNGATWPGSGSYPMGGGGGAGGYAGNGGNGGAGAAEPSGGSVGGGGSGGSGGGGAGGGRYSNAGGGGGVGLYGYGVDGEGGLATPPAVPVGPTIPGSIGLPGLQGGGGSGGGPGSWTFAKQSPNPAVGPNNDGPFIFENSQPITTSGGNYGGGGGNYYKAGGRGAVRIIWGNNREFPKTNVGRLASVSATGGNSTETYTDPTGNWKSHTFTSSGSFVVTSAGSVDVLVVGGGGSGGAGVLSSSNGGGGGAGGMQVAERYPVTAQTYSVTVGDGGDGSTNKESGEDSVFGNITAYGGGYGGNGPNYGMPGGSGGGGPSHSPTSDFGYGDRDTESSTWSGHQGSNGGNGSPSNPQYGSGGGGGAGAAGASGSGSAAGGGGVGKTNHFRYGDPNSDHPSAGDIYYAGGGGGSCSGSTAGNSPTSGVQSGGGVGVYDTAGTNGVDGKGGGGGGGSGHPSANDGGDGGSGIVVIRYRV